MLRMLLLGCEHAGNVRRRGPVTGDAGAFRASKLVSEMVGPLS